VLVAATERSRVARPAVPGLWRRQLLAGASIAVYNLAFFAGVKLAGVAVGTTVAIGSGPLFAGALQALVTRRPPVAPWWLGTALAIAGGAAIALGNGGVAPANVTGLLLCLAAGFAYAVYTLMAKSLSAHASPARASLWVFGTAALIALPAAWLIVPSGVSELLATGARGWLVVAWLGLAATGLAYLLFSSALRFILHGAAQVADEHDREPGEDPIADPDRRPVIVIGHTVAVARDDVGGQRGDDQAEREAPAIAERTQDDRHVEQDRRDELLRREQIDHEGGGQRHNADRHHQAGAHPECVPGNGRGILVGEGAGHGTDR